MYQFLAQRIVIHRRREVEWRLELDVVETSLRGEQTDAIRRLESARGCRTHGECSRVVLHFAGSRFDQIEVLGRHRAVFDV
jgi:hypothetical protein